MFLDSIRITGFAVAQVFILGAIGYFLVKKNILGEACLDAIGRLTIDVALPLLIFCQLIKDFSFVLYPNWWIFPVLSIVITLAGVVVGTLLSVFISGEQHKLQFVNLVAFQNSGYLPLALIAALLTKPEADIVLIYLFLFLLGFNLVMFSYGVYMLTFNKTGKFSWMSLFSPPVAATIISLIMVFFGLNKYVPDVVYTPLKMVGDCSLPLAIIVVGGSLAAIKLKFINLKANALIILAKLIILPSIGLLLILKFKINPLIGLLILIELAVPSAVTLSAIVRTYKKEDILISQGIFFSHLASVITLPVFLSLYFMLAMIR